MPVLNFFPQIDQSSVAILGAAFFVVVIINLIPVLTYPFYIFYVAIHELGHVFAALLSGRKVIGFWVFSNASGVTVSEKYKSNFDLFIGATAGYIGRTLFAALLILLTGLPQFASYTLMGLGILLVLLMFLYGKQTISDTGNLPRVTLVSTAGVGVILMGIAWIADQEWSLFTLDILAIEGAFIALHTITDDLAAQIEVKGRQRNLDPDRVEDITGCSARFWQVAWSILSIIILGAAFWFTWL